MYGKLFESIFDSSIMDQDPVTRLLWKYLIVLADEDGIVDMTDSAIARRCNLPLDQVQASIAKLADADEQSRSDAEEGRRIVPLEYQPYGYRLVNHAKYRDIGTRADRREQNRQAQQRWRDRKQASAAVSKRKRRVTRNKPSDSDSDTDTDSEKIRSPRTVSKRTPDPEFVDFWQVWPRKVAKKDAEKAWRQTSEARPDLSAVLTAVTAQAKAAGWEEDTSFCPYPATWLRAERWADDPAALARGNGRPGNGSEWNAIGRRDTLPSCERCGKPATTYTDGKHDHCAKCAAAYSAEVLAELEASQ